MKQNRSGFPKFQGILQRREQSLQHTTYMVAVKWHGERDEYMLSTVHDSSMIPTGKKNSNTGEQILKPLCINE